MSKVASITPYKSKNELLRVRSLFYENLNDRVSLQLAVDIVRNWQSRGKVPHAINTTACITSVILDDVNTASEKGQINSQTCLALHEKISWNVAEFSLRNAYSMALVRFVNGILDPYQQGSFAVALLILAKDIQLPYLFVEIRHWATHEELPSLEMLRATSQRALQWVYENFWTVLDTMVPPIKKAVSFPPPGNLESTRLLLISALREYKTYAKTLQDSKKNGEAQMLRIAKSISSIAKNETFNHHLADILVLKRALLKDVAFPTICATYNDLVASLSPGSLLLLAFHLLLKFHSNDLENTKDCLSLKNTDNWLELIRLLIRQGPFPFKVYQHVYLSENDVNTSLNNYHRTLDHIAVRPCTLKTTASAPIRTVKFDNAPLLAEVLNNVSSHSDSEKTNKRKNDNLAYTEQKKQKPNGLFQEMTTWRCLPFGKSD